MSFPARATQGNELKRFIEETFQESEIKGCLVDGKWSIEKVRALCEARNIGDKAGIIHEYLCRVYERTRRIVVAAFALFIFAWINAWSFVIATMIIGGDATSGKCENGRYYVAMKGRRKEVSREVWWYSRIHGASVQVGLVAGMGSMLAVFYVAGRNRERRHPMHRKLLMRKLAGSAIRIAITVIAIIAAICLWLWISNRR